MAQHDYNIEDQNGFDFLVDLNNALSAIATNNAGPSEPNPTFPHMIWFDTNNDLMKVRNEANSAWDIVAKKDGSGWTPYQIVNATLSGITTTKRLRTSAGNNATPTGTDHPYQIGLDAGLNVRFDDNAIGAFDNGGGSRLTLNHYGGGVDIGSTAAPQDTRIFGQLQINGITTTTRLRTTAGNDATPTGTDHPYQIGLDAGLNVRFDDNAIGAFDNGGGSRLTLNHYGGGVDIGSTAAPQDTRIFGQLQINGATLDPVGSAPMYACRAWVNFNGTGTVSIRAGGNVSSVTDNGTGEYTVNFATAMQDDNYSAQVTLDHPQSNRDFYQPTGIAKTVSSYRFKQTYDGGAYGEGLDSKSSNVAIFR